MITPVNAHILIEPIKEKSFIPTASDKYQEKGTVVSFDEHIQSNIHKGDIVYFDSWLAAKFPAKEKDEYYWLVKWEDIRAIDYVKH